MGDLNEQLESCIKDRTGKWTAGPKSPNSDKIIEMMRLHELTAANTLFEPKHKEALQTFLQTKRVGHEAHNDYGEYVSIFRFVSSHASFMSDLHDRFLEVPNFF